MSAAFEDFVKALGHTDRLIAGTKTGPGKPNVQEVTMFAASVAFAYAAWEAYVEDVAIEAVKFLSTNIDPAKVPDSARKALEDARPTTWALTVYPGWRQLWVSSVADRAKGDESKNDWGLNTAREKQVRSLFNILGLDPFKAADEADLGSLDELVTARGSVVHAASTPTDFKKAKAQGYRDLVSKLATSVDETIHSQIQALTKLSPW